MSDSIANGQLGGFRRTHLQIEPANKDLFGAVHVFTISEAF
jgi:hypothetical protein